MEQTSEAKPHTGGEKKIPVVEMFGPTIEGEGALIGAQTFFIRFGLCDYRCAKCDSMHAVDPALVKVSATWLTPQEIAENLLEARRKGGYEHIKNVTFSGGNPAIHDLTQLVHLLHDADMTIFVETQGTLAPDWFYNVDHIVVSPKAPTMISPNSKVFDMGIFVNFMHKYLAGGQHMSVKVAVFSAIDLEFAAYITEVCKELTGYRGFNLQEDFYLSLGNPYPPIFKAANGMITQFDPQVEVAEKSDSNINAFANKKALVEHLLKSYNILSEEIMKDKRLSFAKFLPQLHVLVYGNETGK